MAREAWPKPWPGDVETRVVGNCHRCRLRQSSLERSRLAHARRRAGRPSARLPASPPARSACRAGLRAGSSARSGSLSAGRMNVLMPDAAAPPAPSRGCRRPAAPAPQRDLAGHRHVLRAPARSAPPTGSPSPSSRRPTDRPSGSRRPARGCADRASPRKSGEIAELARRATRMWLSAARADSCITLPSWPVRMMFWLPPGSKVASMNSTSPPVSVHATPVATPGRDVRNATSLVNRGGPR